MASYHWEYTQHFQVQTHMNNADLAESAQLTQRDWAEPWIYETHQPLTPRRGIGDEFAMAKWDRISSVFYVFCLFGVL